jgi:WD40 repeat protein
LTLPYDAFLSYSHAAEGRLAPILQSALHRFAKPWYRRRQLHVFRDKTSLTASPALWSSVETALSESGWFLLMASPAAAASAWVQKEIGWWHANRETRKLLICLTDGEIAWDDGANDFDWSRTTALPPALKGCFSEEPLYVDLRWARSDADLSRRHPQFLDAVADIAAALSGRSKEDLIGDDVAQFRRTRRIGVSVTVAIALLAVMASIAAYVATKQMQEARRQARSALSRQLISQSALQLQSRIDRPLLLGLAALHVLPSQEARGQLLRVLERVSGLYAVLPGRETGGFSVAFSPDGKLLAKAGEELDLQLWDVAQRQPSGPPLRGHTQRIKSVAFSPDGRLMATGADDGRILLRDLATRTTVGEPLAVNGHVAALAFSPAAGGFLASLTDTGIVTLWDTATFKQLSVWPAPDTGGYAIAISPDGQAVATGHDRMIALRRADTGEELTRLEAHGFVGSVSFSPDGAHLLTVATSAYAEKEVVLWTPAGESVRGDRVDGDAGGASSLVFSPDGSFVAGMRKGSLVVWKVEPSFEAVRELTDIGTQFGSVQFSPDGKTLALARDDGAILLWDLTIDHPLLTSLVSDIGVSSMTLSPDGRMLTTVSEQPEGGQLAFWDVASRARIGSDLAADAPVTGIAFSPDGRLLAGTLGDRTIRTWDVASRSETKLATGGGRPIAFSPDGKTLASGGDRNGEIALWNLADGKPIGKKLAHSPAVTAIAFSPDGKTLASGSTGGTIVLWDIAALTPKGPPLKGHAGEVVSLAFGSNGRLLASGSWDRTVMLWNVPAVQSTGGPLKGHGHIVTAVAVSPDGETVVSGSADGTVILWSVLNRVPIGGPLQIEGKPVDIRFGPDGTWLAIAREFGGVLRWDVGLESWKALACRIANRNFSLPEWREYLGDAMEYVEVCPGRLLPGEDFRLAPNN